MFSCCCSYIRFKRLLGMVVLLKSAPLPRKLTVLLSMGMVSFSFSYFVYSIGWKTASVMDLLQLCIRDWQWLLIACVIVSSGESHESKIFHLELLMLYVTWWYDNYHEVFQYHNFIYTAQNFCHSSEHFMLYVTWWVDNGVKSVLWYEEIVHFMILNLFWSFLV